MENLNDQWNKLLLQLQKDVVEDLDLKGVLFLIGVQELKLGIKEFTKEEKQDILHLAVCKLLTPYGYFKCEKVSINYSDFKQLTVSINYFCTFPILLI